MTGALSVDTMKADSKISQRRYKKHMVEKRRRNRINTALEQLKAIVLTDLGKDPAKYDKMEKADILDLTVRYMTKVGGTCQAPAAQPARPVPHHMPAFQPAMAAAQPTVLVAPAAERYHNHHLYQYQHQVALVQREPVYSQERPALPPTPPMTPPASPLTPPASPVSVSVSAPVSPVCPLVTPPTSPAKSEGRSSSSLAHLPPKMRVKNMSAVWRPF